MDRARRLWTAAAVIGSALAGWPYRQQGGQDSDNEEDGMATDTAGELVHFRVDGGIGTITLDSPRNRNALSAQLRRELAGHLEAALADPDVRVIVLDHTGRFRSRARLLRISCLLSCPPDREQHRANEHSRPN